MLRVFPRKVAGIAVGLILLSACAGSATGVPARGVPQSAGWAGNGDAAALNLSGQYKGTISTSNIPKVEATLDVGQYRAAIGGNLTIHTPPAVDDAVWTISGNHLAGTIVAPAGPCVFATMATYDAATHILKGSLHAVHGCSASTNGTYRLKHECIYKPAGPAGVRPDAGGLKMC